jgi:hypothetical protein
MKTRAAYWKTVAVVIVGVSAMLAPASGSAGSTTISIVPPSEALAQTGKTYGEWSAAWWQYYLGIPLEDNPGFSETGANCGFMQDGPVFFLMGSPGGSVTRSECRVPSGKILFFPLLTISYYQTHETERGLRGFLQSFVRSARELHASVDGIDIGALVSLDPRDSPLRAASPDGFFPVIAPKDNVFGGVPGQSYNTAADGFYLIVAPLPPGQHTIRFGGVSRNFATDTTYNLTVE